MSALVRLMDDEDVARLDPDLYEKLQRGFQEIYTEGYEYGKRVGLEERVEIHEGQEIEASSADIMVPIRPTHTASGSRMELGLENTSLFVPRQESKAPSARNQTSREVEDDPPDDDQIGFGGGSEDDFDLVGQSTSGDAMLGEDDMDLPQKEPFRKHKKLYYISKFPGDIEIKDADDFITLFGPHLAKKDKFFKVRRSDFWGNGQALTHLTPFRGNQERKNSLYTFLRQGEHQEVNQGWFYVPLDHFKKAAQKFGVFDQVKVLIEYAEREKGDTDDQMMEDPGY